MSPIVLPESPAQEFHRSRFDAAEFDAVALQYEEALQRGLKASGESSDYFASARATWTRKRLDGLSIPRSLPRAIDFGCGTGNTIPYLKKDVGYESVIGLDLSLQSLEVARISHPEPSFQFYTPDAYTPRGEADLVFCNGVFHHIPPDERASNLQFIRNLLRPGGIFAFWENNPWNPGTRYVMSRIPFDRDAIPISIPESRRLIEQSGLRVLSTDTCFYFPRTLKWLRPIEPSLCKIPLGAQYLILSKK